MCLYPRLIKNRKYQPNKKNGHTYVPVFDNRTKAVPIGCGKCIECYKKRSREWQVRLNEEVRHDNSGTMVTLTFSNEALAKLNNDIAQHIQGYERDNDIAKLAVKRFLERWRKKYKKSVKHWLVTELGKQGTENIHLHGIIFTKHKDDIARIWQYGHVRLGEWVNEQTVNYIVKYMHKTDEVHKEYKGIVLTSKGIGSNYIKRIDAKTNIYNGSNTKEYYRTRTGLKLALPIYYRNKIYTEEQREKLWINKLDKNERYVLGQKIDVGTNKGIEKYYRAVKEARKYSKRLGYGGLKDWKRQKYEDERRNLLREIRIKNSNDHREN